MENAEQEKEKQKTSENPYAKRTPQAVKPYASNDGKTADES